MRLVLQLRLVSVLAVAALAISGCGSGKTKTVTEPAATTAGAPAAPTPTTPAPAASTSTTGSVGTPTKPGTVLALGKQGSIVDNVVSTTGKTHPALVGAALDSVQQGSISDLKSFKLDAQSKVAVPFYVKATFQNLSKTPLMNAGLFGYMTVTDGSGDEVQSITLLGDFSRCDGTLPSDLKPEATASECDVYMLPKGQKIAKVQFSGGDTPGVSWKIS
jgi:hypothetical protein